MCNKEVYFGEYFIVAFYWTAERIETLGKNWHRSCLKCGRCYRPITPGYHCKVGVMHVRTLRIKDNLTDMLTLTHIIAQFCYYAMNIHGEIIFNKTLKFV